MFLSIQSALDNLTEIITVTENQIVGGLTYVSTTPRPDP